MCNNTRQQGTNKYNTRQHDTTRIQHEAARVQYDTIRVQHDPTGA